MMGKPYTEQNAADAGRAKSEARSHAETKLQVVRRQLRLIEYHLDDIPEMKKRVGESNDQLKEIEEWMIATSPYKDRQAIL